MSDNELQTLTLFATPEHACGYLDDRSATTVFVDPNITLNGNIFSQLSNYGFRRSGSHVYRPKCQSCQACTPLRVLAQKFKPSRSQKRCLKKNKDLQARTIATIDTDEHYTLFENYISQRHADGDMFPTSQEQYRSFLTSEWGITRFIEFRLEQRLVAVSVYDELEQGLSAIYAFFDPKETSRSLGAYNILYLIQQANASKLPYLYLGYWIEECQKMHYKTAYRPYQLFTNNRWTTENT